MKVALPPAWVMVSVGLILNITAIILSSQVLDKMSGEVAMLQERKNSNLYSIQLAWNQVETLERKRETLQLHLAQSQTITPEISLLLRGQLARWVNADVPEIELANLSELMRLINKAQQGQRNIIDELYLDNLSLTEAIQFVEEEMAYYKNIALFLQIFGLALILARDLSVR
ncbi:DNA mismatch repair protein [Vibrio mediterranei]|uniref:DNA mismatch repair protein n=1 Tax=Vibrio mediterranei TaxID=689 RepID=A0AAN1FJM4_9VIBR|nr:DNA mismatch repair protein [Vibrio mediterranei]ASI91819.1 DNA mismatch repair protein [Vibrio mediterranei]